MSNTAKRCWYCGVVLIKVDRTAQFRGNRTWPPFLTVDHQTPIRKGGSDGPENRVDACLGCNASKRGLTVEEYRFALFSRTEPGKTIKALLSLAKSPALTESAQRDLRSMAAVLQAQHVMPTFWGERNG